MAQKTLEEMAAALRAAGQDLQDARQAAEFARNRETAALNALNDLQRRFDAAVAEVRKAAPRGSDWVDLKQRVAG